MRFANIQALRAFAAYAVVLHHLIDYRNNYVAAGQAPIDLVVFQAGVDIFFVISGFVMAASTAGRRVAPLDFLRARIARVVPLYWALTALPAIALLFGLHAFAWRELTITHLLTSLFFVPLHDAQGAMKMPVLFVGWTLNYEMMFYALFALSLLARRVWAQMLILFALLAALVAANAATANPTLNIMGAGVILEFAAGVGLYHFSRLVRPSVVLAWALAGLSLILFACDAAPGVSARIDADTRAFFLGVPAVLMVFAAVALEAKDVRFDQRAIQFQGDASYAVYLTHPIVYAVIGKITMMTPLHASDAGVALSIAAALAAVIAVGSATYLYLERPLTTWARRTLAGAKPSTEQRSGAEAIRAQ